MNYLTLSKAIQFYKDLGYKYIDVPWLVNKDIIEITLPPTAKPSQIDSGEYLVGSAEQSFISMALSGELTAGNYVACTPCFRDDHVDELHQKYFMKVELIMLRLNDLYDFDAMVGSIITDANGFLSDFGKTQIVKTDIGYDILINGIEVGSYGYRKYGNIHWVYGTGVAEPRLSKATK